MSSNGGSPNRSKRSWRKSLEGRAATFAFKLLCSVFARLNARQADRLGERLGRLIHRLSKKYRERTRANLAMAMPELSDAERARIAQGVFEHFGRVGADLLRTPSRSNEEVVEDIAEIKGDHESLLAYQGGVILISAHFGNWERLCQYLTILQKPVAVVARDPNQPEIAEGLARLRANTGVKVLPRGNAAREILRALKAGEWVGILPDQNDDEVFVPFFGKMVGTVMGPGVMHVRTGAPIYVAYQWRRDDGKFVLEVEGPIQPSPTRENPAEGIMVALNESLERMVRQHPEQWLWLHDRWKSARKRGLL
ncbi:MAG: lysophospholipid acyltransferase family protein [Fimbriimonadaceae bacterium]|nr:lysophospholipid acyltransferase family protein [Fimbriimonadaceae bacterium]